MGRRVPSAATAARSSGEGGMGGKDSQSRGMGTVLGFIWCMLLPGRSTMSGDEVGSALAQDRPLSPLPTWMAPKVMAEKLWTRRRTCFMLMGPDSATRGHQTWTCQAELVCTTQPRGPRVWQQHRGSQCPLATPIRPKPRRLASARGRRRWVLSPVRRRRLSCVFAASWDCCRGGARATLLTSCECAPRLATERNSSQAEACQEASSSSNCTPVNARTP